MSSRGLLALGELTPVIVSYARTPIGGFNGALSSLSAPELGAVAIKAALARAGGLGAADVDEVLMGNVVSANIGQAPATQAAIFAGLGEAIPSTTVNKVCASGMKTAMLAATEIALGLRDVHMGMCAEKCASDFGIGREAQDAYAEESYARARAAAAAIAEEIAPVDVKTRKGITTVSEDEEPAKDTSKLRSLRSAFKKDGTVTAANASKLNDGAAALVVTSLRFAKANGLEPICAIAGFADAQTAPVDFTVAPALAVPKALAHAGVAPGAVDAHEINEAFSVARNAGLGADLSKVNARGGAVSLGHPIGCSGARIVGALALGLARDGQSTGVAVSRAIVVEGRAPRPAAFAMAVEKEDENMEVDGGSTSKGMTSYYATKIGGLERETREKTSTSSG
ncbi:proteasome-activating ATPase [Aureococcus anophagefferens]|nr:proteasome-activating ATPase [Aureococcus anophagefferens]